MAVNSPWKQRATSGGGEFDVPDAGSHPAVLVALIDLGTHDEEFDDKKKQTKVIKQIRKVYMAWELPTEAKPGGGGNFVVARDYGLFFSQNSNLRKMVEKWRGRGLDDGEEFDLTKLLGKSCLISLVQKVSQNGNKYCKIDGVGQLPKGMTCPPATVTPVQWDVGSGDPIPETPWLPYLYGEPLKQVIERSAEYKAGGSGAGDANEEIAF